MKPKPLRKRKKKVVLFRKRAVVDRKTFENFAKKFVDYFCGDKHRTKKRIMMFALLKGFNENFEWFWKVKEGERYGKH